MSTAEPNLQSLATHCSVLEAVNQSFNASITHSYAAIALEHCGCGQAQRSLRPLPSAASEQAWLQYFSPAETGQVQFGWAQRSWVASGMTAPSIEIWYQNGTSFDAVRQDGGCPGYSVSNHPCVPSALTLKTEGSTIIKSAVRIGGKL